MSAFNSHSMLHYHGLNHGHGQVQSVGQCALVALMRTA